MSRRFDTGGAPHFPPQTTVSGIMLHVIFALLPAIAAHVWFFGPGVVVQIALATGFALVFEALMLKLRKQPVVLFLGDFSVVLTAMLFALCIPPLAPWWVAMVGMLFAVVVATTNDANGQSGAYASKPFELGPVPPTVDLRNMVRRHIVRRCCELIDAGAASRNQAFASSNWLSRSTRNCRKSSTSSRNRLKRSE